MIQNGIRTISDYKNLTSKQATSIMQEILSGIATQAQTSAFITALKMKGETIEEITAFAQVLKKNGISIKPNINKKIIDTCGTGGDIAQTFNISTCTAFVLAGTGICVAKHGNRSVTSNCGSADLLEGLGLKLNTDYKQIKKSIEEIFKVKVKKVNTFYTPKGEKRAYITLSIDTPAIDIATQLGLM